MSRTARPSAVRSPRAAGVRRLLSQHVRSGEASGQLAPVLTRLVEHLERIRSLRESVLSASIYPLILLAVAVVSLFAMLGFVVPQFEKLFTDLGEALPMATRIVMKAGQVFRDWGVAIAVGLGLAGWIALRWLRSPRGTAWWQTRILGVPMLGLLLRKYQLTLFPGRWVRFWATVFPC